MTMLVEQLGGEQQHASFAERRAQRTENLDGIEEVLDHLDAGDQVERPGWHLASDPFLGEQRQRDGLAPPRIETPVEQQTHQDALSGAMVETPAGLREQPNRPHTAQRRVDKQRALQQPGVGIRHRQRPVGSLQPVWLRQNERMAIRADAVHDLDVTQHRRRKRRPQFPTADAARFEMSVRR